MLEEIKKIKLEELNKEKVKYYGNFKESKAEA